MSVGIKLWVQKEIPHTEALTSLFLFPNIRFGVCISAYKKKETWCGYVKLMIQINYMYQNVCETLAAKSGKPVVIKAATCMSWVIFMQKEGCHH